MSNYKEIKEEVWEEFFGTIATTAKSITTICKSLRLCPSTVFSKMMKNQDLRDRYDRAKEEQSERLVERLLDITDDAHKQIQSPDMDYGTKNQVLRVFGMERDDIKWLASKLKCKKYGDKQEIDHNIKSVDEVKVVVVDPKKNVSRETE